jgi:hypothetical protein
MIKKKNPFERCFSSPTQHLCTHAEGFRVASFRLVTPGRRRDRGMRHASSDDRSPFRYVSGTFGFAFSFHCPFAFCSTCGKNPQLWKNPKSWEAALETRTHPNAPPQLAHLDPPFVVASESKKLQVQSGRRRRRSTTRIHGWTYSRYFGTRLLYIHRQFLGIG